MKQLDYEKIGQTLRACREEWGFTLRDVEKQTYISRSSICLYENAKRRPSLEAMCALAELYGEDVRDLIFYKEGRP